MIWHPELATLAISRLIQKMTKWLERMLSRISEQNKHPDSYRK